MKVLLLHIPSSHVHNNTTSHYVRGIQCTIEICTSGIINTISSNIYVLGKTETSSCIDIAQVISYININGGFSVIGWYKWGVINDRSVITVNSNGNQNNSNRNRNNLDIQVDNEEIHFYPCSIQLTYQNLLDQTHELGHELANLKLDVFLLNCMQVAHDGGRRRRILTVMQCHDCNRA